MRNTKALIILLLILASGCIKQPPPEDGLLYPVSIGYDHGYMNSRGDVVIEPKWDVARNFSEGLAVVAVDTEYIDEEGFTRTSRKPYFIDKLGEVVLTPDCDDAYGFSEGLAQVKKDYKWGYIDKTGEYVIPPIYSSVTDFSEGVATVRICDWSNDTNDVSHFIDKEGNIIGDESWYAGSFSEGLGAVRVGGVYDRRWGYIDWDAEFIIKPQFDNAKGFHEGFAGVMVNYSWGFIDKQGHLVIGPVFGRIGKFADGLCNVKVGNHWGYIDTEGNYVVEPQFTLVNSFSEGRARVSVWKGAKELSGFIDTSGEMVIDPIFSSAEDFRNGYASVWYKYKPAYIDTNGDYVWRASDWLIF